MQCEDLINGTFVRSEAALISSNQCFDESLQSFTQHACKNLICNGDKAYTPVVGLSHSHNTPVRTLYAIEGRLILL